MVKSPVPRFRPNDLGGMWGTGDLGDRGDRGFAVLGLVRRGGLLPGGRAIVRLGLGRWCWRGGLLAFGRANCPARGN